MHQCMHGMCVGGYKCKTALTSTPPRPAQTNTACMAWEQCMHAPVHAWHVRGWVQVQDGINIHPPPPRPNQYSMHGLGAVHACTSTCMACAWVGTSARRHKHPPPAPPAPPTNTACMAWEHLHSKSGSSVSMREDRCMHQRNHERRQMYASKKT